ACRHPEGCLPRAARKEPGEPGVRGEALSPRPRHRPPGSAAVPENLGAALPEVPGGRDGAARAARSGRGEGGGAFATLTGGVTAGVGASGTGEGSRHDAPPRWCFPPEVALVANRSHAICAKLRARTLSAPAFIPRSIVVRHAACTSR